MSEWANDFLLVILLFSLLVYFICSYVWSYKITKDIYLSRKTTFYMQKKSDRYCIYVVLILFFFLSPFFISYYILRYINYLQGEK